jgi:rhamnulokinase
LTSWRAAIDLGAGSGRALVGSVGAGGVHFQEAHRFQYAARPNAGHLRWDASRLFEGITTGLERAAAVATEHGARLASVGVDSWAVDYGLLDAGGHLIEEPICYRDDRTEGVMDEVFGIVPRAEIFEPTGIQFLRLNTLYQLFAHARAGVSRDAA